MRERRDNLHPASSSAGVLVCSKTVYRRSVWGQKKFKKTKNENELRLKYMGALRYIVARMNAVAKGRLWSGSPTNERENKHTEQFYILSNSKRRKSTN